MIAAGANNISNIKIGNTQIKNIFLGNSGIWTDKTTFNYTVTEKITFDDNYEIYHQNIYPINSYLKKSVDGTNYTALQYIQSSDSELNSEVYINDMGYSEFLQSESYIDTIYKSDANKFQLTNNIFWYMDGTMKYLELGNTATNTLITNSELSGRLILIDTSKNITFEINPTSPKKIETLNVYMGSADFSVQTFEGVSGLFLHLQVSLSNYGGTKQFTSSSKFNLPYILVNKFMEDDIGIEYNFNDNIVMYSDEFIQRWSFVDNVITLDLWKEYNYSGSVYNSYCEAAIINNNNQGGINISLDGQFDNNKIIYCYNDYDLYFYNHTEYITDFSVYNTAPVNATITHYAAYIDYTLVDDFS